MYEIKKYDSILVGIFYGYVLQPEILRFNQIVRDRLAKKDLFIITIPIYMENITIFDNILDEVTNSQSQFLIKKIYSLSPESKPSLIPRLSWISKNKIMGLKKTTASTLDKLFRKIEVDMVKYPSLERSYNNYHQDIHQFIYQTEQKASLLPLCMNNL